MTNWTIDIARQSGWDLWCWVCLIAAGGLVIHWVLGRGTQEQQTSRRMLTCLIPAGLTGLILSIEGLRDPLVGLFWTTGILILLSGIQYQDLRHRLSQTQLRWLLLMRVLAVLLAVPMLFEPVLSWTTRRVPDRPLVLLVDHSGSMSVPDAQNGPTRIQSVVQALSRRWDWISDRFKPVIIPFPGSGNEALVDTPQSLSSVQANGSVTDLVAAVAKAQAAFPQSDAQIVLISDGIDNVSDNVVSRVSMFRRPVHTLLVGSESPQGVSVSNIQIDRVDAGDEWTVGSTVNIKVNIKSASLSGRVIDVNLAEVDEQDKPISSVKTSKLVLETSSGGQELVLEYVPRRVGVHRLAVWVDPVPGERTVADNRRVFQQLASEPRIRVLYIEGKFRPEYRELSRALARDTGIELATLVWGPDGRFSSSGTINPQPVGELPQDVSEWRRFDVVILGDVDRALLTEVGMSSLEKAVQEGTGLVLLGGASSLGTGGYETTPIEQALPVWLGSKDTGEQKQDFFPKITEDGLAHPMLQGLETWLGGDSGSRGLYPLSGNWMVSGPKPQAKVLLIHPGLTGPDGNPQIILAVQTHGKGRSAVLTVDSTYHWYLSTRTLGPQSPYTIFWGQLVRWLAGSEQKNGDKVTGVEALVDKPVFQPDEPIRVRALVRNDKGEMVRFAAVRIQVDQKGDSQSRPLVVPMAPVSNRDGLYQTTITQLGKGDWSGQIIASKDGVEIGRKTVSFSVVWPDDEMARLVADGRLMQQIATTTGGYAYRLSQLHQLLETLSQKQGEQTWMRQRSVPLYSVVRTVLAGVGVFPSWPKSWDLPIQTSIVLTLLVSEWVLRRRWQLL